MNLYETDTYLFAILVLNIAREAAPRLHEADKRMSEFPIKVSSETH